MPRCTVLVGVVVLSLSVSAGCTSSSPEEPNPEPDISGLKLAVRYEGGERLGSSGVIVPAACAAGVEWDGTFHGIRSGGLSNVPDPQPDERIEGAVAPGCNDTGNLEPDRPVEAWSIEGVDTERAIFVMYP
jgi:hypothetical protein